MSLFSPLLIFLCTTVAAYWGVDLFRQWALRHQMVYEPNELTAHTRPVPHGGGLIIVLTVLMGFVGAIGVDHRLPLLTLIAYLNGAIVVAIVSWFDDVNYVSMGLRFATQSLAALILVAALVITMMQTGSGLWMGQWRWLAGLLAFFWLVGFANLFNFMDGIDGMAGLQAVIAGVAWMVIGWYAELPALLALGLLIAAASLGFLGHNWAPARVIMGDVSSVFLGYTLAAMPLLAAQSDPLLLPVGILIIWPCVFDPAQTLLRRICHGESIFIRHRSFLFHRLVIAGYDHASVSLGYGGLSLVASVLAVTWYMNVVTVGLTLTVGGMAIALWRLVNRLDGRQPPRDRPAEAPLIELADAVTQR